MSTATNPVRDELFRLIGQGEARSEARRREMRMLASLLRGDGYFMGVRAVVTVTFPDGSPMGLSNAALADLLDPPVGGTEGATE